MPVDARDAAMRVLQWEIIQALVAAYQNAEKSTLYSSAEVHGHRCGVRDVAVRLGLYGEFTAALERADD